MDGKISKRIKKKSTACERQKRRRGKEQSREKRRGQRRSKRWSSKGKRKGVVTFNAPIPGVRGINWAI